MKRKQGEVMGEQVADGLDLVAEEIMLAQKTLPPEVESASNLEVLAAILEACRNMNPVAKSGHNKHDDYRYSTIGDYLDAIRKPCQEAGLVVMFEIEGVPEFFQTPSGKMPCGCRVVVKHSVTHPNSGEQYTHISHGEAFDRGDKALYKALTGARKYGLQGIFDLYSEDDPEIDSVPQDDAPNQRYGNQQNQCQGRIQRSQPTGQSQVPQSGTSTSETPAPTGPPTFEQWKERIVSKVTSDELLAFTRKALAFPMLQEDPAMMHSVVQEIGKRVEVLVVNKVWNDMEADPIDRLLDEFSKSEEQAGKQIDSPETQEEMP